MTNCSQAETQQLHIHSNISYFRLFCICEDNKSPMLPKSCYGTICPNIPGSMTRIFSIIPANKQQHIKPNV